MRTILLHLVPASLYAALGVAFWRSCIARPAGAAKGICMPTRERLLLLVAMLAHGVALHASIFPADQMRFGFGVAISLMVWLAICFYWVETLYTRLEGLHAVVMPAGALASLLPLFFPGEHVLANATSPAFRAHFVIAMLAYSLFTLAALHAMLMSVAGRQLHNARFSRLLAGLPPLLTMEALLFRLIGIAFILLTLTLISGVMFSETLFGQAFRLEHKTLFALVSWLLFGALLVGRHLWGWRGRVALRWTLAGFIALMLAYVGSRFVIEVVLQRAG
ncbi:MAG: cytochrome c biogenesis protein CcsA [Thauera propionica]|uniref:Cytochrome C biogenesis protein n=1 Tax=Thauera propionica TaxID=2019431 RepID=A0A235EYN9_9RHOO|nr:MULTISPECIES: cytochrome c biogenesis protein CcsA [Thauera]MDD3676959.1 cytochrome c biogenesis protein CcsA [Thauera propionica]MDY0047317.1 cytochrome c biogenesis protein CcsA [Thauera propionica]OYD54091.1 cytochrome C biogenesis protein [Thauera propionica]